VRLSITATQTIDSYFYPAMEEYDSFLTPPLHVPSRSGFIPGELSFHKRFSGRLHRGIPAGNRPDHSELNNVDGGRGGLALPSHAYHKFSAYSQLSALTVGGSGVSLELRCLEDLRYEYCLF
jgi:hypothetical protein